MAAAAAQIAPTGAASTIPANKAADASASASASQTWPTAKLTLNPSTGEVTASFEGKSTAPLKNPQASALRAALGDERATKLKKNKELKGVSVEVVQRSNILQLKGLSAP
jgi:hypothetical protein